MHISKRRSTLNKREQGEEKKKIKTIWGLNASGKVKWKNKISRENTIKKEAMHNNGTYRVYNGESVHSVFQRMRKKRRSESAHKKKLPNILSLSLFLVAVRSVVARPTFSIAFVLSLF